jgi:hypothetical protein
MFDRERPRCYLHIALLSVLLLSAQSVAQELPLNFEFKRETGQKTGVPIFSLMPRAEAVEYDAMRGSTFEALGALTQPERGKYGLIFINAKEEYQLHLQKEKGVVITVDGEEFIIPEYITNVRGAAGQLKIESATIVISEKIFENLVKASDVVIRVGVVIYNLDQDNIDALHYYGAEIKRDLARRKKRGTDTALAPQAPATQTTRRTSRQSTGRRYMLGPRGGCYYISGSGKKVYVDRNLCN